MNQENTYWVNIIGKFLSGEISEKETTALSEWLAESDENSTLFDQYRRLWGKKIDSLDATKIDIDADWKIVQSNIQSREDSSSQKNLKRNNFKIVPMIRKIAAAAAIFLLCFMSYNIYQKMNLDQPGLASIEYSADQTYPIQLPDGSQVWLNKGSSIEYDETFEIRKVALSGEAFFEVVKNPDSPFEVNAFGSTTRVLGTRFNVKVDTLLQTIDLYVEEGKVAFGLTDELSATQIVTAGEGAVATRKRRIVEKIALVDANAVSWKSRTLNFEHQPMARIISDISKYFDITLKVSDPGILDCHLKANFVEPTLEDVFETISFSLGGRVDKINNEYIINATPCNTQETNH